VSVELIPLGRREPSSLSQCRPFILWSFCSLSPSFVCRHAAHEDMCWLLPFALFLPHIQSHLSYLTPRDSLARSHHATDITLTRDARRLLPSDHQHFRARYSFASCLAVCLSNEWISGRRSSRPAVFHTNHPYTCRCSPGNPTTGGSAG
jgi:hypothetical protein